MKNIKKSQARIALTNLGAYNNGTLLYEWLNVPCTEDEFGEALKRIGVDGVQFEEYFVSDFENIDGISEYSSFETINEVARRRELLADFVGEYSDRPISAEAFIEALESVIREVLPSDHDIHDVENFLEYVHPFTATNYKDIDGYTRKATSGDNYFDFLRYNDAELHELTESRFADFFDAYEYTEHIISCDEGVRYYDEDILIIYYG